jgi:hypothetical protein
LLRGSLFAPLGLLLAREVHSVLGHHHPARQRCAWLFTMPFCPPR